MTPTHDVLIIGGGPGGSTCARRLVAAGAHVAVVDRAEFPRVKLCAGWLSPSIWDVLELAPREYPHGLWEWHTAHVHYRGKDHAIPCHGWFIRRFELDHYLLRTSGADLHLGVNVKEIGREGDLWTVTTPAGELRARYLVGAGGTHCPVARKLALSRPRRAVGVQELEFQTDGAAVERTRLGENGEPELLLFDDIGGYGWNVPKSDWLNVGCGTLDATRVRDAWTHTHDHLRGAGHLPAEAEEPLAQLKGHSYFLYDPVHIAGAQRDTALLVGDSLGLAHPITAEGILPATASGRRAAEAILAGDPASYRGRLDADPTLADYRRVHRMMGVASRLKRRSSSDAGASAGSGAPGPSARGTGTPASTHLPASRPGGVGSALARRAVARGFAWMFSGRKLPAPRLLDLLFG